MKRSVILIFLIMLGAVIAAQPRDVRPGFAVVPFDNPFGGYETEEKGISLSSILEKTFPLAEMFNLRKAGAVFDYLKKMALMQAGFVSDEAVAADMKTIHVDYITVGTVSFFDGRYEVDERTVNVGTWEVVQTCGVSTDSLDYAAEAIRHDMRQSLSVLSSAGHDGRRPLVTVNRFVSPGGEEQGSGYGDALAEMINTGLAVNRDLAVIERKFSGSLVMEKELEMAGIVETGEDLDSFRADGVEYVLSGEIRLFPDIICISYRVHGTNGRASIVAGYHEIAGSIALRPLSERITGHVMNVLVKKTGTLILDVLPADSLVYVDNHLHESRYTVPLPTGDHVLKIEREGYEPIEERITVAAGTVLSRQFRLKPDGDPSGLRVKSGPGDGRSEWERRVWNEYDRREKTKKTPGEGRTL